ncbi:MAG: hypothetical protein K2W84_04010 [Burkholderiales bacterium]|nr:hypothetical protein [Burkholderiales bacterium]
MRKLLLILLLAIMPSQATWAGVAAYCQHEQGAAVSHFGHHDHGCRDAKASVTDAEGQPAGSSFADGDCQVCHGGIVAVSPVSPALTVAPPSSEVLRGTPVLSLPDFASHPERPNWSALA